jgi:rhamnogalacturonan endolyase
MRITERKLTRRALVRDITLGAGCALLGAPGRAASNGPVSVAEDASAYTLANGIVTARVDKKSGDLLSLRYRGAEMLATILGPDGLPDTAIDPPGANKRGGGGRYTDHQYGFWSHDTTGPNTTAKVTIDPKSNSGDRAEVSIKGISGGAPMGAGPGGSFISDIEIRYAMGRDDSGVYTYSIFEHQPGYPASTLGEARFCVKLNAGFDWMSISEKQNHLYAKETGPHEDKYDFTVNQFENPAFGWSSTAKKVGVYILNPTVEYLSGGPTKVEFQGHRDTNQVAAPCILNYWRSSHYGGAMVDVAADEHWTKVIGPFLIYCNSEGDPQTLFKDAREHCAKESAKWPYEWVSGVDYPRRKQRAAVKGQLAFADPMMPAGARVSRLRVGLAHPAYTAPATRPGAPAREVDWQTDAKHYEFWALADDQGRFALPNVRPGPYTLRAFGDGALGEYAKTGINIEPGKPIDLGKLTWKPVRRGRQVWEIGVPNRTGSEYLKGDEFNHDGMALLYAKLFPNDVNYVIGKSDFRKDWYFLHVPHSEDPNAKAGMFGTGAGNGRATPWTVTFEMPGAPRGQVTLRVAIAGGGARQIDLAMNDQPAGKIERLPDSGISHNGIMGIWREHELPIDVSLMKAGTNVLKLTMPGGPVNQGVIYDYLRLEIDENAK